jgi:hypothetical protein
MFTLQQPDHTATLDALDELVEAFIGLSSELEWCTSEDISRKELLPIFRMCSQGSLSPEQALDVVMSNVMVKKDETFTVMRSIVSRLSRQLSEYSLVHRGSSSGPEEGSEASHSE